jgi:type VI secretion system protein ImpC
MLWGHPALLPALLLAQTWAKQGAKMQLGSVMSVGEMSYYVYTDTDGEQIALPCTERLYTERQAVQVANYRVMPLLSIRGRPEVRLGGFASLAGTPLAGFWGAPVLKPSPAAAATPAPAPAPAAPPAEEAPPVEAAPAVEAAAEAPAAAAEQDLDALLAGLDAGAPAAGEPEAAAAPADDLDALLASLNAEPPPAAPDATEPDLDALLASLK